MSKYTTEVRYICESVAGLSESVGGNSVASTIASARDKIFNFDYPIFDENYRSVLETKILKHYYTREIAHETVGLWKLKLDTLMNEIMPYYNQLYKSTLLEFNPFYDTDITRKQDNKNDTTKAENETTGGTTNIVGSNTIGSTTTDNVNSTGWNLHSDTPQNGLTGVEDLKYLTDAKKDTGEEERTGTVNGEGSSTSDETRTGTKNAGATINNVEDYLETVKGKQGGESYSKMLQEYRQTFVNIDMRVIDDLGELFFNLW